MTSSDCTNPFEIPNHSENNNYPLKRVSPLIQSHAKQIGFDLEIGQRICDKCRLFARNKFVQATRKQKSKARTSKATHPKATTSNIPMPPKNSYLMPTSDSSNNDSNEPYSQKYHQQQALRRKNKTAIDLENEYTEYINYSNDYNFATNQEEASTSNALNDNSNSLFNIATPNPISEFKIVNVTSLPAEKHNEIMNNDDNAMNAMDSAYNHRLKISEIISTASNSNVFGIAKKADESNSLLTIASSKPYLAMPNKSMKKQHSKIQKLKQEMQNNYRLSGTHAQNVDEVSSTSIAARKECTDSDDHSNSKFNFTKSRRKNALTPLRNCEMEFMEINPPKLKKQAHMTDEQRMLSSQLETVKSIKNPNADLLRKVAFLRVCVNYMMTELEGETFHFGKNITYEHLKTKYNSKRLA